MEVAKKVLMRSQVFQDMLGTPQNPSRTSAQQPVKLEQSEDALKKSFALMADDPSVQDLTLKDFEALLPLNDKYDLTHFRLAIVENVMKNASSNPLLALSLAVQFKDRRLVQHCIQQLGSKYEITRELLNQSGYGSHRAEVSSLDASVLTDVSAMQSHIAVPLLLAIGKTFNSPGGYSWKDVSWQFDI